MIKVRVPATSANLGAGFDCLGLAVNLYNYIGISEYDGIDISSTDGTWIPTTDKNMIYSSAQHLYDICGKQFKGLKIVQENNIPMTRGLGSSSACIVGGLVGANVLMGSPLSKEELVDIASDLEGHPDNTTPALMGGILTAVLSGNHVYWVKQEVQSSLKLVAIIPDFKMSTAEARKVLPENVTHLDARFNLSRAALFSASLLQGKYENLRVAVEDKLHQQYRMQLIPHSNEVFDKCYELNAYATYLSGAGPTIMAVIDGKDNEFINKLRMYLGELQLDGWAIKQLSVDNAGTIVE